MEYFYLMNMKSQILENASTLLEIIITTNNSAIWKTSDIPKFSSNYLTYIIQWNQCVRINNKTFVSGLIALWTFSVRSDVNDSASNRFLVSVCVLSKFKETEMGSPVDFFIGLGKSLISQLRYFTSNTTEHYAVESEIIFGIDLIL